MRDNNTVTKNAYNTALGAFVNFNLSIGKWEKKSLPKSISVVFYFAASHI